MNMLSLQWLRKYYARSLFHNAAVIVKKPVMYVLLIFVIVEYFVILISINIIYNISMHSKFNGMLLVTGNKYSVAMMITFGVLS